MSLEYLLTADNLVHLIDRCFDSSAIKRMIRCFHLRDGASGVRRDSDDPRVTNKTNTRQFQRRYSTMRTSRRLTEALLALCALVVMGTSALAADPVLTYPWASGKSAIRKPDRY
jgi:nicotinic acid phosphoribosyltransferase